MVLNKQDNWLKFVEESINANKHVHGAKQNILTIGSIQDLKRIDHHYYYNFTFTNVSSNPTQARVPSDVM